MMVKRKTLLTFVLVLSIILASTPLVFSENINDTYDYLIITTSDLESSLEYFKNWKEHIGYQVRIINISWIKENYDGRDTAEKMKTFLQSIYEEWDVKYVLLAGDMNQIPMRHTYQPITSEIAIPTDFYYADLTSDWDTDGDGIYAEFLDDEWPDFTAELYVGRIPVSDPIEMQRICQKIIEYEQDTGTWKRSALLIGAMSNFENEQLTGDKLGDNAVLMEQIKHDILANNGFMSTTLYEKQGLVTSIYESDEILNRETSLNHLSMDYGIVNWASHGSSTGSYRRWWAQDADGDYVPDLNEIRCEYFITSEDTRALDDSKPFIAFSCSCTNAYPEESENLGVSLLKNGAVAFVGATRESIYFPGWQNASDGGNMAINYKFLQYIINENKTVGEALFQALTYSWYHDETPVFRNMLVFNLYGDPSLSFNTFDGLDVPQKPKSPTGPFAVEPNTIANLSYLVDETLLDSVYLIWDFGDGTLSDPMGPYSHNEMVTLQHSWNIPGDHAIRVKKVNMIGDESDWSPPLEVHVNGPIIDIESVTAGLFKINAAIRNSGDRAASDIQWSISIEGGNILLGRNTTGVFQNIDINNKKTIISKLVFGIGFSTNITVSAICSEGSKDTYTVKANILFSHIHITEDV